MEIRPHMLIDRQIMDKLQNPELMKQLHNAVGKIAGTAFDYGYCNGFKDLLRMYLTDQFVMFGNETVVDSVQAIVIERRSYDENPWQALLETLQQRQERIKQPQEISVWILEPDMRLVLAPS